MKKIFIALFVCCVLVGCEQKPDVVLIQEEMEVLKLEKDKQAPEQALEKEKKRIETELSIDEIIVEMGDNPVIDSCYGNCEDGVGAQLYPDGNKYVGGFMGGKENGQGTYSWVDGSKYVGEFKMGVINGQGTYTSADGAIYHSGLWVDGQPAKSK